MSTRRAQRPQGPPEALPAAEQATEAPPESAFVGSTIRDIGKGFRWYDLPYLLLRKIQSSSLMLALPARWRLKVREATNFMYQTHYTRERRRGDYRFSFDNIEMPDGEGVSMPSAWAIEYFTASNVRRLYDAIRRSGWDGARFLGSGPRGTESLSTSRRGGGETWWRIAELKSRPGGYSFLEAQQAKLPRGVESISLIGVSIGKGLTAVVVAFSLEDSVSVRLNQQLHAPHRYEVIRRKGQRAVSQPPAAVLQYRLQRARSEVHRDLRAWMSRTLPGAFAEARQPHPLFDVVFFNIADLVNIDSSTSRTANHAMRGVGVNSNALYRITSTQLPGLVLEESDIRAWAPEIDDSVWTLWGNRRSGEEILRGTGNSGIGAAGRYIGSLMTDYMARSGLTALLQLLRSEASAAHDNARNLHGGTSSRDLKRLRNRTLTTSLDLATLEEDVRTYNGQRWRDREPTFYLDSAEWLKKRDAEEGRKRSEPFDINKHERKRQRQLARELVAFDGEYRAVLSTVASLGASLDSRRVQRVAIWVSVVSVGVALVTLWVSQDPPPDLLAAGCAFLRTLASSIC